jgi:hypothetical protein
MKEWIKDNRRPEVTKAVGDEWGKSKKVLVLIEDQEPLVAEFNKGEDWEQWYCPAYEDVVEGVTGWCDCIPDAR